MCFAALSFSPFCDAGKERCKAQTSPPPQQGFYTDLVTRVMQCCYLAVMMLFSLKQRFV